MKRTPIVARAYTPSPEQQSRDYVPRYHPRYDAAAERPAPVRLTVHRSQVYIPPVSHVSDLSPEQIERAKAARLSARPSAAQPAPQRQIVLARENRGQRVLRLLKDRASPVMLGDLAQDLGLRKVDITDATKALRARGMILSRRVGQETEYSAAQEAP